MRLPWQPQPEAGRTALAYYEVGLRRWRAQVRLPLLVMLAFALVCAIPAWRYFPHGEFEAGVFIGAALGIGAWIRDEPPDYIARRKRGAEGEQETWKSLLALEREGWRGFHDRDGGRGNLDHIVVGPGGVFLLDSKKLSGSVRVEAEGLTISHSDAPRDSFTYRHLAASMRGHAVDLKDAIEAATGVRRWVQAVVVIWGDFPDRLVEADKVVYIAGPQLCDWLRARVRQLEPRDQRLVEQSSRLMWCNANSSVTLLASQAASSAGTSSVCARSSSSTRTSASDSADR